MDELGDYARNNLSAEIVNYSDQWETLPGGATIFNFNNSDQYAVIPNRFFNVFRNVPSVTLLMWVRSNSLISGSDILFSTALNGTLYKFALELANGYCKVQLATEGDIAQTFFAGGTRIEDDGQMHHIAITVNLITQARRIVVDGVDGVVAGQWHNTKTFFGTEWIGEVLVASNPNHTALYDGAVGQVQFFLTEMSLRRIQARYKEELPYFS